MAGSFSKTAYERLPAAVKKMEVSAQTVCIHLRLRRTPDRIALETGFSGQEVARLIGEVKRTLIVSGNYDLIAPPQFVPIGEEGGVEPVAEEVSNEDRILAREFMDALKRSVAGLSRNDRRLLSLYFERRMSAGEIMEFYRASGIFPERDGWMPESESEIFYLLDKALHRLLSSLSEETPIGRGTLTVKGLKEVLYETGLEVA